MGIVVPKRGQDAGAGDFERAIAERVPPQFDDIEQRIRKAGGGVGEQTRPF